MFATRWMIVALVLALGIASSVKAHEIEVEHSDPPADSVLERSPEFVSIWFSDEIQSDGSTLEVFNVEGEQIDNQDGGVDLDDPAHASMRVSLPQLPVGAYTVRWHAVLLDGDESDGEFGFFVGTFAEATEQASPSAAGGASTRCLIGGLGGVFIFLAMAALYKRKAHHLSLL